VSRGAAPEQSAELWTDLTQQFPGVRVGRLVTSLDDNDLLQLEQRATENDPSYRPVDFTRYVAIDCPHGIDPHEVAKALRALRSVEVAYVEGGPTPPPVNAVDDPRSANQGYLDAAPDGIDAEYAWTIAGGDGTGIGFVDMEQGWTLNHEDLVAAGIGLISGTNQAWFGHGTAVLGEVVATDNTLGNIGATPAATARVVSQWRTAVNYNTTEAILDGVANMQFGDVLLLEAQTTVPGAAGYMPVEAEDAVFDAIRLGTAVGVAIVEAAGNGSNDLDAYSHPVHGQILNRTSPDFRDSGAIMVGAATSATPHSPMWFTNFGSRIDCYGWGQNIDTTGDGYGGNLTTTYTTSFGGTSGASPIVSSAAIAMQGMNEASLGYRLSPQQLRVILADPTNGTASANPVGDRIGVMPNLHFIADSVLGVTPDVYLRDYVGDVGDSHTGAISASPDIIVRPVAVVDPQAAFGELSGTENANTLGYEAEAGQDNYVYVRVRNRGAVAATNVVGTVYWSPPATLVTPDLWTLVGTTTIATVPPGDILTCAPGITWTSGAVPATGHYCFVGILGTANDPAPTPGDLMNWSNFEKLIRENNNVTWRNFNVVNNVPPSGVSPPGFIQLPFLIPGAPDRARRFRLELLARLPQRVELVLEAPLHFVELLRDGLHVIERDAKRGLAQLRIARSGRHSLGQVALPAKYRAQCRLLVRLDEGDRKYPYEVAMRQLYGNLEVGRVTWRLAPRRVRPTPQ
jgi:hypothetical protein